MPRRLAHVGEKREAPAPIDAEPRAAGLEIASGEEAFGPTTPPARPDAHGTRRDWRRRPARSADVRANATRARHMRARRCSRLRLRAPRERRQRGEFLDVAPPSGVKPPRRALAQASARTRRNDAAPRDGSVDLHPRRRIVAAREQRPATPVRASTSAMSALRARAPPPNRRRPGNRRRSYVASRGAHGEASGARVRAALSAAGMA